MSRLRIVPSHPGMAAFAGAIAAGPAAWIAVAALRTRPQPTRREVLAMATPGAAAPGAADFVMFVT
jgi:hypothetical protein